MLLSSCSYYWIYYWDTFAADPVEQQTVQPETLRREELPPTATKDNVYFHSVRDQMPVGKAKNFQASQRNIINKAE